MSKLTGKMKGLSFGKPSTLATIVIGAILIYNVLISVFKKVVSTVGSVDFTTTIDTYLYVGALTFLTLVVLFGGWHVLKDKPFASKVVFYIVAIIMLATSVVWIMFGYVDGQAFDPLTAEPNRMYDPSTRTISEFTPQECRPADTPHKGYDYTQFDGCYSAITGAKLLPITSEIARVVQPRAWASLVYEWIPHDSKPGKKQEQNQPPVIPEVIYPKQPEVTHPIGSPTSVVVPSCQSGEMVNLPIPNGWSVHLAWNEKAARYLYRSMETGEWTRSLKGGVDAVKFCALHEAYADDTMVIDWHRI